MVLRSLPTISSGLFYTDAIELLFSKRVLLWIYAVQTPVRSGGRTAFPELHLKKQWNVTAFYLLSLPFLRTRNRKQIQRELTITKLLSAESAKKYSFEKYTNTYGENMSFVWRLFNRLNFNNCQISLKCFAASRWKTFGHSKQYVSNNNNVFRILLFRVEAVLTEANNFV